MKKSYIYAIISVLIWSSMATILKVLLNGIPNLEVLFFGGTFAFVFLLIINIKNGSIKEVKKYSIKDIAIITGGSFISSDIFNSLNRLNDAKQSGSLQDTELSSLIISIGDVFANKIKQGKVTEEEIESANLHLSGFTGKNKDKYFSYNKP